MTKFTLPTTILLAQSLATTAFSPTASSGVTTLTAYTPSAAKGANGFGPLFAEGGDGKASEAVFIPPEEALDAEALGKEIKAAREGVSLDVAEGLGKGSAKKKRGRRKGSSSETKAPTKAAATLTPEEVFYEGPPAITETLIPTISILTVIGIIPAAASWARQLWVKYKITDRRIRVNSGVNGKDMAEIVYPDVTELRTVKRLLGDGDMVLFLRDGAKFEMRNIPNFDDTLEFILKQLDEDVVKEYKLSGDVTNP